MKMQRDLRTAFAANLFYASYRFGKPVTEIFRAVAPLLAALAAALVVVTYVPWLSTFLPALRG